MSTRIIQYLHRPNATELGLTGTHDTYLLIKSDIDLHGLFPVDIQQQFIDVETQKPYNLKSAEGREFRVNQMGEYYREKGVRPGDDIIIQKIIRNGKQALYIDVISQKRLMLLKYKQGYDIANLDVLPLYAEGQRKYKFEAYWNGIFGTLSIDFAKSDLKRSDSPELTAFYSVTFNGVPITEKHLILSLGKVNALTPFKKYEYHEIMWED